MILFRGPVLGFFLLSASAGATGFPSTVPALDIPNAHVLSEATSEQGAVLRSAAPNTDELTRQAVAYGVTDLIVFKHQTGKEVDVEKAGFESAWDEAGTPSPKLTQLSFHWKKFPSYPEACEQTIDALQLIFDARRDPSRKVLFHCTVGEDRTGHLAGLYRMLADGWSASQAFQDEMCVHGYEAGNPVKPANVVDAIRTDMTPLFLAMAELIRTGKLSVENLDRGICQTISVTPAYPEPAYRCGHSALYAK